MSESRSKILWLRRRFNDSEIMDLLKDIVVEGFDYVNPCDYETYPGYETNIINGSIPTFINSYTELSGDVFVEDNELDEFIRKVIIGKFRGLILREYRDRYCEEDEDDDEDMMITETKDNQIRSFILSHFYQELNDFYNKHKKPLTESEHLKGLFLELPLSLKRRVTMEYLEWLDKEKTDHINGMVGRRDFDTFCYDVLGDLLHEFVVERKDDEIDIVDSPEYGLVYSEDGFNEVASIYWKLIPYLKKRYEIKLRQAFERKRQQ